MGCTGSRHALRGGVRKSFARSRSGPATVHHTVALKSSTLGSLSLDRNEEMMKWRADSFGGAGAGAKAAPTLTPTQPPKPQPAGRQRQALVGAPAKTPVVRDPEVINVWELMEGLDDTKNEERDGGDDEPREQSPPEFDPEILSAFRKELGEVLSPPRDSNQVGDPAECGVKKREIQRFPGIVRARVSAFQQRIDAKLAKMAARPPTPTPTSPPPSPPPPPPPPQAPRLPPPPDSHRKVVVYLTSLRGIRKTFEDCWATKSILHGYGVRVDERDLSLHGGFKDELHASLGSAGGRLLLPQVFVDGEHLGGADDVRRMHEAGELSEALLEACEMAPTGVGGGGKGGVDALEGCSGCGGVRFVPCEECSGSCKVFLEELDSFRRCPECNENGLVRCPLCCL